MAVEVRSLMSTIFKQQKTLLQHEALFRDVLGGKKGRKARKRRPASRVATSLQIGKQADPPPNSASRHSYVQVNNECDGIT